MVKMIDKTLGSVRYLALLIFKFFKYKAHLDLFLFPYLFHIYTYISDIRKAFDDFER